MKKTTVIIATLFVLLVGAQKAQTAPMYYTFDGNITVALDNAGIIAGQMGPSFGVGSAVTYTFIVDLTAGGYHTNNNGDVTNYTDTGSRNYFYTDYYSGDSLQSINGGWYNNPLHTGYNPSHMAERNYGYDDLTATPHTGSILGGIRDNRVDIYSQGNGFPSTNWTPGTTGLQGSDWAYDSDGSYSHAYSSLTLTSISSTAPGASVPEPASLLLLGSGLFGFGLFRRVRKEG